MHLSALWSSWALVNFCVAVDNLGEINFLDDALWYPETTLSFAESMDESFDPYSFGPDYESSNSLFATVDHIETAGSLPTIMDDVNWNPFSSVADHDETSDSSFTMTEIIDEDSNTAFDDNWQDWDGSFVTNYDYDGLF